MNYTRLLTLFSVLFLLHSAVFAQCDNCPELPEGATSDFCYTQPEPFSDLCAHFAESRSSFWLKRKKKYMEVPLQADADVAFFAGLAKERKLKLSALEILFVQEAVKAWETAKLKLGYTLEDSGLGIKIVEEGTGALPEKGKKVTVHYTGKLEDGTTFDSSIERGQPFGFVLGQGRVIKGWDEGIAKLKIGSKAWLQIPPELGYGARGAGNAIPPNATLYFYVEVIKSGE